MIRSACVLTALLALMLQGSSGGHMLLVEHSRCAEHGEMVHGDAHPHGAGERWQAGAAGLHGLPDAGSEETHDHCSITTDRRDGLVSIDDANASAQLPEAKGALGFLGTPIASSTPRLRIAPKTSPPA